MRRMSLVSDSSTMKVDLPLPISSDAPIRLDVSSSYGRRQRVILRLNSIVKT